MKRYLVPTATGIALVLVILAFHPRSGQAGELSAVPLVSRVELNLPDLSAQQRTLDEFTGKVLLVNFWASWCRPCLQEIPGLRQLAEEMHDRPFAVIGVNVGEAERRVQATVKRFEIDYPVLLDRDGEVFRGWGATVLPTAYILDHSGKVRYIAQGPLEWDRVDIVEKMRELAEQAPGPARSSLR